MIDLFIPPVVRPYGASIVHRIWVDKSKLSRSDYYRQWYAENRQKRLDAMRKHYEAHKDEYKARAKRWRKENPERYDEIKRKSRKKAIYASLQVEVGVSDSGGTGGNRGNGRSDG